MTSAKHDPEAILHHRLDIAAKLIALIGLGGLAMLVLFTDAQAQTPPPGAGGFNSGAKPFTASPFSNDSDDEEDEEDFAPVAPPARGGAPGLGTGNGGVSAGGQRSSDGAEPVRTQGGVSLGGSQGTVVSKGKPEAISIDTISGEGSKEIVTDFNFPDADIMDIAKTLGKLTGKNFILDKDVKGKITIITNGAISVGDAWRAFLTALDINDFALIPSGSFIRIARQRNARDKQLKTFSGDSTPDTDALITRIFQLKYVNAEEVARAFHQFVPASARIFPYEQTNTIIVTDSGSNIAKLAKILELLDVEGFDAGIEVVPVKWASASELSKLIDTLLPGATGGAAGAPGGAPRFGGGGGSRFSARRTKEGGVINTIISDERTNSLIIHANAKGVDQVRELVAKLDQKLPSPSGGGKVHVVYLQFADAEAIANTINNLSQSSGQRSAPTGAAGAGTGTNPVATALFEGSIRVSPDKATNSLVVTASPGDFVTVQRVINRLDIARDEVYVEVVIMEVGVDKKFDFSANLVNPGNGIGSLTADASTLANYALSSGLGLPGAVLGFSAGGTKSVTVGGQSVTVGNVMGLVSLLQKNANANVLATPQILAIDNTDATFETTEKVPMSGGTTAVQGAGVAQNIQYQPVTLSIKIKPQINKVYNFVKLDVEVKSGDISTRTPPAGLVGQAFGTIDRSAKTTVVVADSDTAVLGGLIRDKVTDSESKVPILGDIPILGWLFKSKNSEMSKTNMLIFMTPHIVRKYEKVRALLDKKLKERDDWLERSTGGKDPMRYRRDEIIRSLPDISEVANAKIERSVEIDDDAAATLVDKQPFTGGTRPAPTPVPGNAPPTAPIATPIQPQPQAAPPAEAAPATGAGSFAPIQPAEPMAPAPPPADSAPPTAPAAPPVSAPAGGT